MVDKIGTPGELEVASKPLKLNFTRSAFSAAVLTSMIPDHRVAVQGPVVGVGNRRPAALGHEKLPERPHVHWLRCGRAPKDTAPIRTPRPFDYGPAESFLSPRNGKETAEAFTALTSPRPARLRTQFSQYDNESNCDFYSASLSGSVLSTKNPGIARCLNHALLTELWE
jgi:hypothetical protein